MHISSLQSRMYIILAIIWTPYKFISARHKLIKIPTSLQLNLYTMNDPLLHPSPTTTPSPSVSTICVRLAFFFVLLALALFANHDSAKHIDISFTSASTSSPLARRFDLLFVSNGRAQRVILDSTAHIQGILYSDNAYPKKTTVNRVVVQLATHNLPGPATVRPGSEMGEFVISLCPSLLMEREAGGRVELALRRAMASVWAWDCDVEVVNGLVERLSGSGMGKDPIRGLADGNVSTSAVGPRQVV